MDADAGAGSPCDEVHLAAGIARHGDLSGDGSLVGGCRGGDGVDIGALNVAATAIRQGLSAELSSSVATFIRENNLYDN